MTLMCDRNIEALVKTEELLTPWTLKTKHTLDVPGCQFEGGDQVTLSGGVSVAGYDLVLAIDTTLFPDGSVTLTYAAERFKMPKDLVAVMHDKSTLARLGIQVQNTVAEPGWEGYLTLEITMSSRVRAADGKILYDYTKFADNGFFIPKGTPICQALFHELNAESQGYDGKYQDQPAEATRAR